MLVGAGFPSQPVRGRLLRALFAPLGLVGRERPVSGVNFCSSRWLGRRMRPLWKATALTNAPNALIPRRRERRGRVRAGDRKTGAVCGAG